VFKYAGIESSLINYSLVHVSDSDKSPR